METSELKYNVGDKVIVLNLDYFDNWFHYKLSIKEYTVLYAGEKYFSQYYAKTPGYISGSEQFAYCSQVTGKPIWGQEIYLHKEKDADKINSLIQEAVDDYNKKRNDEDEKRLNVLISTIKTAKEDIEKIKKGEGNFKQGFSSENRNAYMSKVMDHINKTFVTQHP